VSGEESGALAEIAAGRTLSDLAYDRVLEALFDRRVPAGAFVSQSELVKLLGIPVAPLRDALRALEAEGVLAIHPRSGIQFVKPGLELTRATYQFRTIVERAAVRVFAETAAEEELERIDRRHRKLIASVEKRGLSAESLGELEELENLLK
jgi:DNA-binding GntR family transcriptional regulator